MTASPRSTLPWLLGGAALLAASAYLNRRMTAHAQAQHPPNGRFVAVEGLRLHYTEHGDPSHPPLVMLHGEGTMARELELSGLVEQAAKRYHVFVFDRPGYGYSERPHGRGVTAKAQAELLLGALRRLDVKGPLVLGHSWGTLVASWMALLQPAAVRALVLVSGYYTPSVRFDTPVLAVPAVPLLGTLMRHTLSPWLSRLAWPLMLRRMFAPAAVSQPFRDAYPVWLSLRPGQLRASASDAAMLLPEALRLRRREHELAVPTVIVAGEKDRMVMTGWQSRRLHRRLPGSDLHIVPGAGHMVHHTAPAAVMAAIDAALRNASGERHVTSAMQPKPVLTQS